MLPAGSTGAPSNVWIRPITTFKTMEPTTSINVCGREADTCSVTATVERAATAVVVSTALVTALFAGSGLSAGAPAEAADITGSDLAGAWVAVAVVADLRVDTVL